MDTTISTISSQQIVLDRFPFLIGRSRECDAQLPDRLISRKHCRFVIDDDGEFWIEDQSSRNGTYVNQEKVQGARRVNTGDLIQIGCYCFRCHRSEFAGKPIVRLRQKTPPAMQVA